MFWQEDRDEDKPYVVPDDIVDVNYRVDCRALPLDHAHALSRALLAALPWLADEPRAGIHLIHGAESGNGWMRPEDVENALLHLSRRTRMTLRLPRERLEDAEALVGQELDIDGHRLRVGESSVKKLSPLSTLFARHVVVDPAHDEQAFLQAVAGEIQALGVPVTKLMPGKSHAFRTPDGVVYTRSVMIADLDPEHAVRLQEEGVGPLRKMGCGLFIPHKGIKAVNAKG